MPWTAEADHEIIPMPASDAHLHAFQDDRTERASLERINRIRGDWQAYVTGIEEEDGRTNKEARDES